jgi:hypothetical protein
VAAKAAGTRPSKARRAGRGGIRKAGSARRTKPVWREAPVIDPSLVFTALSWGTSTTLPGFGAVQCTPEFARVEADRAAATGARRKADELELLVTLVELAALGHSSHAFA